MKTMKSVIRVISDLVRKEQGSALIIALIIMLALTLLGLSLLLQSNTEYVISINERDSTAALYNAEAALQMTKEKLRSFGGTDLTDALDGPDPAVTTDNGVIAIMNPSLTDVTLLDETNEQTDSAIVTLPDNQIYEAFRIGVDNDGDTAWDGPRGLVYVRIADNYDDYPAANSPWTDTDKRVTAHVISQYPIQVDSNGNVTGESKTFHFRIAGVSTRELVGRFGTAQTQAAIVSLQDMELGGSLHVCGECGSVHADSDLTIDADPDFHICENATETNDQPVVSGGTIDGTVGYSAFVPVPVANPFHEDYAPDPEWFDTNTDTELASYPGLQCDYDTSANISKFFALVGDSGDGQVYKAYWNAGTSRWDWFLIDDLNDNLDTTLDECGRVISGAFKTDSDADASRSVDDAENAQFKSFYGFDLQHGSDFNSCDEDLDDTLGPTSNENDFIDNAAFGGSFILPGTFGSDTDDDYEAGQWYGKNDRLWKSNASDVYAPMYNAVIFVWGNLTLSGNLNNVCTNSGCTGLPGGIWRVTFLSLGNINASGGPRYAPVRKFEVLPDNQYLMVAGRDIELSGTPGEGDICPLTCDDLPANLAGYAGIVLAHEQISLTGNVSVNGVIKAEDAAQCANLVSGAGIQATGSVEVYYDCEHPPDTSSETTVMTSWEEVQ
ncbi:hypothetical protein L0222_06735 [bacterium]|nr:hypothetical protein [bacterium]